MTCRRIWQYPPVGNYRILQSESGVGNHRELKDNDGFRWSESDYWILSDSFGSDRVNLTWGWSLCLKSELFHRERCVLEQPMQCLKVSQTICYFLYKIV